MERKLLLLLIPFLSLGFLLGAGSGAAAAPSHADRISSFEGPRSCAPCHADAAREVAVSLHYQQGLEPQFLIGWEKGKLAGQLSSF